MRIALASGLLSLVAHEAPAAELATAQTPGIKNCLELPGVYEMDFFAFFATVEEAISAAAEINDSIFDIEVRRAATGPEWVVQAVYRRLPEPDFHAQQVDAMRSIAAKHGSQQSVGCSYRPSSR